MEIKQSILNPFGPRETMGSSSGGNSWNHGRGVIGSPGAEPPPPAAIIGPTTNWLTFFGGRFILPSTIYPDPETVWADIIANPTAYSLVIEGGPQAGTYPISEASQFGPTAPGIVGLSVDTPEFDFPDRLIGLEGAEMSYFVGNGWTPTAGTASIVLA